MKTLLLVLLLVAQAAADMHMVATDSSVKGDDKKLFVEVYPPDEMEDPLENMRSYDNMNKVQFGLDDLQTAMEKVTRDRQNPYPVPSWGSSFMNNMKVPGMMGASNYQGGFLMEQKLMTNLGLPRFQQMDNQQGPPMEAQSQSLEYQQQQLQEQQQKYYQQQQQQQYQRQQQMQPQQPQSEESQKADKTVNDLAGKSFHDIFAQTMSQNGMDNPSQVQNKPQFVKQQLSQKKESHLTKQEEVADQKVVEQKVVEQKVAEQKVALPPAQTIPDGALPNPVEESASAAGVLNGPLASEDGPIQS